MYLFVHVFAYFPILSLSLFVYVLQLLLLCVCVKHKPVLKQAAGSEQRGKCVGRKRRRRVHLHMCMCESVLVGRGLYKEEDGVKSQD